MSVPIITIHSDKGGVAKSTTAVTLVDYFAREGRKVLAVDCDPGGEVEGLTMMRGTLAADDSATTYGLISHGDRVVMRDGMALVPADRDDLDSLNEDSGGAALTDLRDRLQEEAARLGFDVVVIDTATGSSTFLTLSAILAATTSSSPPRRPSSRSAASSPPSTPSSRSPPRRWPTPPSPTTSAC